MARDYSSWKPRLTPFQSVYYFFFGNCSYLSSFATQNRHAPTTLTQPTQRRRVPSIHRCQPFQRHIRQGKHQWNFKPLLRGSSPRSCYTPQYHVISLRALARRGKVQACDLCPSTKGQARDLCPATKGQARDLCPATEGQARDLCPATNEATLVYAVVGPVCQW